MSLVDHYESHLGPIEAGWVDRESARKSFQVVSFGDAPRKGATTFCTLGLSKVPLRSSGRSVRQELVAMCLTEALEGTLPAVLHQIGAECLAAGEGLRLRQVIGPRGPLLEGASVEAFYVATPVYLPDSFGIYEPPGGPRVLIGWLVPITAAEAGFVRDQGAEAFEARLASTDPDLLDFARPSLVHASGGG